MDSPQRDLSKLGQSYIPLPPYPWPWWSNCAGVYFDLNGNWKKAKMQIILFHWNVSNEFILHFFFLCFCFPGYIEQPAAVVEWITSRTTTTTTTHWSYSPLCLLPCCWGWFQVTAEYLSTLNNWSGHPPELSTSTRPMSLTSFLFLLHLSILGLPVVGEGGSCDESQDVSGFESLIPDTVE